MNERLIDVLDSNGTVLHTYPITLSESAHTADAFDDSPYRLKALAAAAHSRLVADTELSSLTARLHIDRGGQLAPYGDDIDSNSETKRALDEAVRERAYLLWECDGRPDGRAEEYWQRARDQHIRERAYVLWQQQGSPEGRQDEFWRRLVDFQAH
jgi:hypothetical protein